jgi:hypothetical protein
MSKITSIAVAVAMVAVLAKPAHAQTNPLQNYQAFLSQHPEAAEALSTDPGLYRSSAFMAQHPDVWSYLNQNPTLYQSMAGRVPAWRPDTSAYALSDYLHTHPGLAQNLAANPAEATNPAFLRQHPEFARFLAHHPTARQQIAMRGWNFSRWEQTHQWNQRNQWRDADDWSDRDWHEQWERQRQLLHEREEAQEAEAHEHHDRGKHLGWYKHEGKHHEGGYEATRTSIMAAIAAAAPVVIISITATTIRHRALFRHLRHQGA